MEDEVKTENTTLTADDYLKNLQALRDTTVSKEDYNRLVEENKKLANALAQGNPYNNDDNDEEPVDVDALRKSFAGNHTSNLALFTDILNLRKEVMARGERDPFLPTNPDYVYNEADAAKAQYIADQIQECVDYAEGDWSVFNLALAKKCGATMKAPMR